ncbi:MAG: phosphoglycerate dehydrogenase [Methanomassiliicoccales archaeon]|nr:MAG: phosphoglycerate dehydrogenase [Methanomassiliicoccales archaeon]
MKILITDELSKEGIEMLTKDGAIQVDVRPKISQEELIKIIGDYEALIVRSGTKVTAQVIEAGKKLRVVGRAGVGVDNVDVEAATRRGVLVMNTPAANIISASEHTMAMMLAWARNIPSADVSMKEGKWERSKFMGIELSGKTLGIVGIGRIGGEVAKKAKAFGMKLVGYDPFISQELAVKLGVRLLPLDKVLQESDIITIHAPLTPTTHHLIGKAQFDMMKPHAVLINCARGEIVDENALVEALETKRIAGAALDVFEKEPPKGSKLLTLPNVVLTPHLGASTKEAQEKVSVEMAEHVKLFLLENKITNAVNAPISKVDPKVAPFIPIAERLGSFCMQIVDGPVKKVEVEMHGEIANLDTKMVTVSALIGVLQNVTGETTNVINAISIAREKGIQVVESKVDEAGLFTNMLVVRISSDGTKHEVRGTAFPSDQPRILGVDEFDLDMPLEGDFILTKHDDMPGMIGKIGNALGSRKVNIARMGVGRVGKLGRALMLISVDDPVDKTVLEELRALQNFNEVRYITLSHMRTKEYMNI